MLSHTVTVTKGGQIQATSTDVVLTITKVIDLVVVLKQTNSIRSLYLIGINFVAYFIHKNYTYITLK